MSRTLTGLIPIIYAARNTVARELTGMIPAVTLNNKGEDGISTAAKDQVIRVPIVGDADLEDITPGNEPADSGDNETTYATITMDKFKAYPIRWESEEEVSLGSQMGDYMRQEFENAFRAHANLIESELCGLYKYGSRGYGVAGTTPFASSLTQAAQMKKILDDNGCPAAGRSLVIDTLAGVNLRTLSNLTASYAAGTDQTLRQGTLLPLMNFDIKESAQIKSHTKGTATGFDSNGGEPVGEITIVVDGSDSGTILPGDIVTFAGDTNKYIVTSATASGAATGNIVIGKPGLVLTLATTTEGTIGDSYTANMAFHRSAIILAARTPKGGDKATDEMIVTDRLTGISYRVAVYGQYMRKKIEVQVLFGVAAIKPEFIATLIG